MLIECEVLQTHWEGLAAADLFTVEVLTLAGLRRYFVFFVIELKTRRVHIAGIHPHPALVHNSRSRSIIALHPEIRGPA